MSNFFVGSLSFKGSKLYSQNIWVIAESVCGLEFCIDTTFEGCTSEIGSFTEAQLSNLNGSVPSLITQRHIFEQRLSSTYSTHTVEITLDWAKFLISLRHEHIIRFYRWFGANKTPYVFDILWYLGGSSVRNLTMVKVVLPCCCPDGLSVLVSVDDVNREFWRILENQSTACIRDTEWLL